MTALWILYAIGVVVAIGFVWVFLSHRNDGCGLGWMFLALALGWPLAGAALLVARLVEAVRRELERRIFGDGS